MVWIGFASELIADFHWQPITEFQVVGKVLTWLKKRFRD
jgi:hypothetical protein